MQRVSACILRTLELAIVGFVLFVVLNVGAEIMHKPILPDRVAMPHHMVHPAAQVK